MHHISHATASTPTIEQPSTAHEHIRHRHTRYGDSPKPPAGTPHQSAPALFLRLGRGLLVLAFAIVLLLIMLTGVAVSAGVASFPAEPRSHHDGNVALSVQGGQEINVSPIMPSTRQLVHDDIDDDGFHGSAALCNEGCRRCQWLFQ